MKEVDLFTIGYVCECWVTGCDLPLSDAAWEILNEKRKEEFKDLFCSVVVKGHEYGRKILSRHNKIYLLVEDVE